MNEKISDLPIRVQRFGRMYDRIMVMSCGYREVTIDDCMGCGGFTGAMLKNKRRNRTKPKSIYRLVTN